MRYRECKINLNIQEQERQNHSHVKWRLYFHFHIQEHPLFYFVFAVESKGLSYNFYHIFFQTIVSFLALCTLKYHRKVAVTNKAIFGAGILFEKKFCFSSLVKAVIGRYVIWIEKGKYAAKLEFRN